MDGDNFALAIAHNSDQSRIAAPAFPVGQVRVCSEIGVRRHHEAAAAQVCCGCRTGEGSGPIEDERDLTCGLLLRVRRWYGGWSDLPARQAGRPPGMLGRMSK